MKKLVENNERFKEANLNDKSLLADLIHNNPSMFDKDGNVYADAKWEKLDFPTDLSKYLQAWFNKFSLKNVVALGSLKFVVG